MPSLPPDNRYDSVFEQLIADALGPETLPELTTGEAFLGSLNRKLESVHQTPSSAQARYLLWIQGISKGAVAVACGLILYTGLNVIPPILVNSSVTGACLAQNNIMEFSWRSRVLWDQLIINIENQTQLLFEKAHTQD